EASRMRGICGLEGGGEFRQADAEADRFLHMGKRRVVMAGKSDAARRTGPGDLRSMRLGILGRQSLLALAKGFKGGIGEAALGLMVKRVLIHRLELPLAWRMVHQGDEADLRIVLELHEMVEHIAGRDLAA